MTEFGYFTAAYLIAFAVALGMLFGLWRLRRRRLLAVPFVLIGGLALIAGVYFFWYTHRLLPEPAQMMLFPGVEYVREVRTEPRQMVIHVVTIDLTTPGLRFLVTPGNSEFPARVTSQFLENYGLQVAINGDFFDPWRDYGFWDYYPHTGNPVSVRGLAVSDGETAAEGYAPPSGYATLYLSSDNRAAFNVPEGDTANAISGNVMLVQDGEPNDFARTDLYLNLPHPRTAVAVDQTGQQLILILVDGRQPSYSDGANILELAEIVQRYGGYHALNLDGGGSTTLVIEGENGDPQVMNSPIHSRIPGRERPIANHLGIYVPRSSR